MMKLGNLHYSLALVCFVTYVTSISGTKPGVICASGIGNCSSGTTGLICDQSLDPHVCKCPDNQHFDYHSDIPRCRINGGQACELPIPPEMDPCGENAVCDNSTGAAICVCADGFLGQGEYCAKSGLGACEIDQDAQCNNLGGFFSCVDNKCFCKSPLVLDTENVTCKARPGEPCSSDDPTDIDREFPQCYYRATCNMSSRVCDCKKGFSRNLAGECVKFHGQACQKGAGECDATAYLDCPSSFCLCRQGSYYDRATFTCKLLVDQKCRKETPPFCTDGATCSPETGTCQCEDPRQQMSDFKCGCTESRLLWDHPLAPKMECYANVNDTCGNSDSIPCDPAATCSNGDDSQCICRSGAEVHTNGFCYFSYNSTCERDIECLPGLVCLNSTATCGCPEPRFGQLPKIYDRLTKTCLTRAAETCVVDRSPCVQGASCGPRQCECMTNYKPGVAANDGLCVGGHMAACGGSAVCNATAGLECNPVTNRCSCPLSRSYDEIRRICFVRSGFACNGTKDSCDWGFNCLPGPGTVSTVCTWAKSAASGIFIISSSALLFTLVAALTAA